MRALASGKFQLEDLGILEGAGGRRVALADSAQPPAFARVQAGGGTFALRHGAGANEGKRSQGRVAGAVVRRVAMPMEPEANATAGGDADKLIEIAKPVVPGLAATPRQTDWIVGHEDARAGSQPVEEGGQPVELRPAD